MQIKNIKLLTLLSLLYFPILVFSQQLSPQKLYDYTEDNVLTLLGASKDWLKGEVHIILKSDNNKYEGNPLEIFDNSEFNSKPIYYLTSEGITEDKRETKFQKIVKNNKSEGEFFKFSDYDFISLSRSGTHVGLKGNDFSKSYIQIVHGNKKYFLKISEDLLKYLKKHPYFFTYNFVFIGKTHQLEFDQKLNQIPDFKKFIVSLKECVIAKDQECLYKYIDEYTIEQDLEKDHFKKIFLVRQILDDPNLCDEWKKTRDNIDESDNHIPKGFEKRVDKSKSNVWDSLALAVSLDLDINYIVLSSNNPNEGINAVSIYKRPFADIRCENLVDVDFNFVKRRGGWRIKRFGLNRYD